MSKSQKRGGFRGGKSNSPKRDDQRAGKGGGKSAARFDGKQRDTRPRIERAEDHAEERLERKRDDARWVVGIHSCMETLKVRGKRVRELWLRDDFERSEQLREIHDRAGKSRVQIKTKSAGQLDSVGSGHQGVALAVLESPDLDWNSLKGEGKKLVLVLDGLEDPHNLGSILRTAWLTACDAILIPEDRAVGLTPAVCKIASGGAEHVPVEQHTNLASVMQDLKEAGFWIYGLSEKGKNRPWDFKLPEKVAWVIGSEGSGLRITTERACDELVRIPQVETGSSYNASIAAAMALAETCRQLGRPD